jgi:hypothetical protein
MFNSVCILFLSYVRVTECHTYLPIQNIFIPHIELNINELKGYFIFLATF